MHIVHVTRPLAMGPKLVAIRIGRPCQSPSKPCREGGQPPRCTTSRRYWVVDAKSSRWEPTCEVTDVSDPENTGDHIPVDRLNPRAATILREAALWADAYQSGYVGSEHLLLALIDQRGGPAYDLLTRHTNVEDILRGLKAMLSHPGGSVQAP